MATTAVPTSLVVLASGGVRAALPEKLGCARAQRLTELMTDRLVACASEVLGPDAVSIDGGRAGSLGERVAAVCARLGDRERVLLAVPELGAWRTDVLRGALDDLSAGCAASVGAVFDGGFYLAALVGPVPAALAFDAAGWEDRDLPGRLLLAAGEDGLEVGMLRPERALRTAGDLRAVLVDPLTDPELRTMLEG